MNRSAQTVTAPQRKSRPGSKIQVRNYVARTWIAFAVFDLGTVIGHKCPMLYARIHARNHPKTYSVPKAGYPRPNRPRHMGIAVRNRHFRSIPYALSVQRGIRPLPERITIAANIRVRIECGITVAAPPAASPQRHSPDYKCPKAYRRQRRTVTINLCGRIAVHFMHEMPRRRKTLAEANGHGRAVFLYSLRGHSCTKA